MYYETWKFIPLILDYKKKAGLLWFLYEIWSNEQKYEAIKLFAN